MRGQGVFENLPADVRDELVRCYFQHVHFFLPVIDVPGFLKEYTKDGSQHVNRMLLWSMMLAAANVRKFCDISLVREYSYRLM